MGVVSTLLFAAVLAGPPVTVSTFAGAELKGELQSFEDGQLVLTVDGAEKKLAAADLLELRFETESGSPDKESPFLTMADGTKLTCKTIAATEKTLTVETVNLGPLTLPMESVYSLRLAPQTNTFAEDWGKLVDERDARDRLVIIKGQLLDHLKGVLGPINETQVNFALGGNAVAVDRKRVFGVIYGNRPLPKTLAICRALFPNGDGVELKSVTWVGESFQAELLSGGKITLSPEKLVNLDFSLGKVQYLSAMEPRKKKLTEPKVFESQPPPPSYTEFHDVQINRNLDGKPLKLDKKTYARGLWIHSKTELTYRLSKEYRRFQAVMGIEDTAKKNGKGDVRVLIIADGKSLVDTIVRVTDKAQKLDLDVSGVVSLEIIVDFAHEFDIGTGDHLTLGDAKLIK